jgi:hypothetical protein
MAMCVTFGVDPGLSGAIATLIDGEPGPILDMPTFHNGTANEVDAMAVARFIRDTRAENPGAYVTACIERVRAMPARQGGTVRTMGAQSSFNFGDGFGQVKAAFRVLGIEPLFVEARSWKSHFRLDKAKSASLDLARVRFPSVVDQLKRVKDNGRGEALLVALWADSTDARAAA